MIVKLRSSIDGEMWLCAVLSILCLMLQIACDIASAKMSVPIGGGVPGHLAVGFGGALLAAMRQHFNLTTTPDPAIPGSPTP